MAFDSSVGLLFTISAKDAASATFNQVAANLESGIKKSSVTSNASLESLTKGFGTVEKNLERMLTNLSPIGGKVAISLAKGFSSAFSSISGDADKLENKLTKTFSSFEKLFNKEFAGKSNNLSQMFDIDPQKFGTAEKAFGDFVSKFQSLQGAGAQTGAAIKLFGTDAAPVIGDLGSLGEAGAAAGVSIGAIAAPVAIAGAVILAAGAIAYEVTAKLYELTKAASEFGDKIYQIKTKTGESAETISALNLAAEESGVSIDRVSTSLVLFEKKIGAAREGSKSAVEVMKRLFGDDWKNQVADSDKALEAVFNRISNLSDPVARIKAATDAFGRSGADMLKIIDAAGGSFEQFKKHAEDLGVVMSEEDAQAAHEFQKSLNELELQGKSLEFLFAKDLFPVFTEVFQGIGGFLADNKQTIADWGSYIGNIVKGVVESFRQIFHFVEEHKDFFNAMLKVAEGVGRVALAIGTGGVSEATINTANTFAEIGGNTNSAKTLDRGRTSGRKDIDEFYIKYGSKFGIDPNLLLEQGRQESINFKESVLSGKLASPKGAVGVSQFMPDTASRYQVDRYNIEDSIRGQAQYMSDLLKKFNGRVDLALAGYNWGEARNTLKDAAASGKSVLNYSIPTETRGYVTSILNKRQKGSGAPIDDYDVENLQNNQAKEYQLVLKHNEAITKLRDDEIKSRLETANRANEQERISDGQARAARIKAANDTFNLAKEKADKSVEAAKYARAHDAKGVDDDKIAEVEEARDAKIQEASRARDKAIQAAEDKFNADHLKKTVEHNKHVEGLQDETDKRLISAARQAINEHAITYAAGEAKINEIQEAAAKRRIGNLEAELKIAGNPAERHKIQDEIETAKAKEATAATEQQQRLDDAADKDKQRTRARLAADEALTAAHYKFLAAQTEANQQQEEFDAQDKYERGSQSFEDYQKNLNAIAEKYLRQRQERTAAFGTDEDGNKNVIVGGELFDKLVKLRQERDLTKENSDERLAYDNQIQALEAEIKTTRINQEKEVAALRHSNHVQEIKNIQERAALLAKAKLDELKAENDLAQFRQEQRRKELVNIAGYSTSAARLKALQDLKAFDLAENDRQEKAAADEAQAEHDRELAKIKDKEKEKGTVAEINKLLQTRLDLIAAEHGAKQDDINDKSDRPIEQAQAESTNAGAFGAGLFQGFGKSVITEYDDAGNAVNNFGNVFKSVGDTVGKSIQQMAQGIGSLVSNWVLLGNSGGQSARKFVAQVLSAVAAQATTMAVMELAYGIAASSGPWGVALYGNPGAHFAAAALFGSIALGSALVGRGVAGNAFQNQTSPNAISGKATTTGANSQANNERTITEDRVKRQEQTHVLEMRVPQGWFERHVVDDFNSLGTLRNAVLRVVEQN